MTGKGQFAEFDYSLMDWEGIVDINDKPIPGNEEMVHRIDVRGGGCAFFGKAPVAISTTL